MKPIAGALALVMLLAVPAAGAQDATPGDRTKYASYKASAELHCDNSAIYGQVGDSPSWWDANPLQNKDNPYQAIDDAGAINKYTSYLGAIKADASCLSESPTGLEQLDLAKCAYRETQNMLFACYSAASMLRIAEEMQTRFAGDGRAKDMLKRRIDALRKLSVGEGTNEGVCNPINIKAGVSVKEWLLKNSSVQMCRYVYYLDYLSANADSNIQTFIGKTDLTGEREIQDTEAAARKLGGVKAAISSEAARVRDVHRTAVSVFMDMERTYGLHLMLTLIYEDFVDVRERLRSLLNPIGQFVYKASNAQSPYNQ